MLIDRPQVVEGTVIVNATVPSGTAFPSSANAGELFYLTTGATGLYSHDGSAWNLAAKAVDLTTHIADQTLHLTSVQNTLVDGITVLASDINTIPNTNARVTTLENGLTTHLADQTLHLTAAQNTLLDGLAATLTATELNFVDGVTSSIQTQLNSIVGVNNTQTSDIANLQTSTTNASNTTNTNLSNHIADQTVHLTTSQNTLLDGITVGFADVNKLTGLSAFLTTSSLASYIANLNSTKLNADGTMAVTGIMNHSGYRISGVGTPTQAADAATKAYVDNFVQGLHWVTAAKYATTVNLPTLSGLLTIDGVAVQQNDRILVKDQTTQATNGVYLAATGAWSRVVDFNAPDEMTNSALFVLAGATQSKSTWVQLNTITTVGTDPIQFSAFSGPVINTAGPGISLGTGGMVSVLEGAGLKFSSNVLVVDLFATGGLMTTTDGNASSTVTNAQLSLTPVGSAGTYRSVTTDSYGRITAGTNPTTIAGYGLTDAVGKTGAQTMAGPLTVTNAISGGTTITAATGLVATTGGVSSQGSNAILYLSRSSAAGGQNSVTMSDAGGTGNAWQLYQQANDNDLRIYRTGVGDIMQINNTTGNTAFKFGLTITGASSVAGNLTMSGNSRTIYGPNSTWSGYLSIGGNGGQDFTHVSGTASIATSNGNLHMDAGVGQAMYLNYLAGTQVVFGNGASGPSGASVSSGGVMTATSFVGPLSGNATSSTITSGWNQNGTATNANTYFTTTPVSQRWWVEANGSTNAPNGGWWFIENMRHSNGANYWGTQKAWGWEDNPNELYTRNISAGTWGGWVRMLSSANYNSYAPTLTGGNASGTWGINITGNAATANSATSATSATTATNVISNPNRTDGTAYPVVWNTTGGSSQNYTCAAVVIQSSIGLLQASTLRANTGGGYIQMQPGPASNTGYLEFTAANGNRQGYIGYANTVGSTDTGTLNYVAGNHAFNGPIVSTGDVTAYSDLRKKKDILVIENAGSKVAALTGVTFTHTDTGHRSTGVIAQEVQKVLPEAVIEGEGGLLAVKYGNLVGLLIESIKELQAEVAELKAKLG